MWIVSFVNVLAKLTIQNVNDYLVHFLVQSSEMEICMQIGHIFSSNLTELKGDLDITLEFCT